MPDVWRPERAGRDDLTGAELDLFTILAGRRLGFELQYADAPRSTRSMRVALEDLSLEEL